MFDHVGIPAADVEASLTFYTTVFAPLGFHEARRFETPGGPVVAIAGRNGQPNFWLNPHAGGVPEGRTPENHIAFLAQSAAEVDAVHEAALAAGAEVLHAPRFWPEYHEGYYAVFLRDPDGHNVEAKTTVLVA